MTDFTPSDDEKENNRIFDRIMGDGDSDKAWKNYEEARRVERQDEHDGPISDEEWNDLWLRPKQKREAAKERWHDRGDVNSDPYSPHDPKEKTWTPSRPSPFDNPKEADRLPPYEYPPEEQDEYPKGPPFEPRTEPSPYDESPKDRPRMPPYPPKELPYDDADDPSLNKAIFDTAFDLMKFGDCPVCLGDPAECPSPNEPMSECGTRRNAIKHMKRGKGARPPTTLR